MPFSDIEIIDEAIRLVEDGVDVTFPVNGRSMLPFIIGGKESLVLVKPACLNVGDVVLAFVDGNRYVIHRIVKISGDDIVLMGDGNLAQREFCKRPDVKALANYVIDSAGRKRFLYSRLRRFAARLWMFALPIRKWLLKIYLVIYKVRFLRRKCDNEN